MEKLFAQTMVETDEKHVLGKFFSTTDYISYNKNKTNNYNNNNNENNRRKQERLFEAASVFAQ